MQRGSLGILIMFIRDLVAEVNVALSNNTETRKKLFPRVFIKAKHFTFVTKLMSDCRVCV